MATTGASSPLAALLRIPAAMALDVSERGVLVGANTGGTMQLRLVPLEGGEAQPLTDLPEPVSGRFVPGTTQVLVTMDHGGDERHQLYLLDAPLAPLRPLVVDHEHIHRLGGFSHDGHRVAYATNRRNGLDFDVVVHDLRDGSEQVVFDRGGWCEPGNFSPDGRWVSLARATDKSMDNDLFLCDLHSGEVVHATPHQDDASYLDPAWLADSSAFLAATDAGRDTMSLARYDLATRTWSDALEVGWECSCWFDRSGERLLLAANENGRTRLDVLDARTLQPVAIVPLPEHGVAWREDLLPRPRFTPDGRSVVFSFTSPQRPPGVWVVDIDGSNSVPRCLTETPREVAVEDCVMPEMHSIVSFDGETVPAFVYRPAPPRARSGEGPPPVVVLIHGGPESQTTLMWNPVIQAFVARGYAVVAPNVRGSTGYGKRYAHLDDVRLRLDSVRDLAALHAWLPGAGLDSNRAVLSGGSYGGYMVLCGLAFQPDLWAAGVDIVGMSSLVTFLENTSVWRRAVREREYGRLDTDRDFLVEASPLTQVDRMRAPLFIIHGANDPRVPLSEAEQIHAVLQGKGVASELLVYHDEGHGLARLDNRLDAYPRVFDFLDRVLSRTQQG
jgi:dipeptidyl aminopeptidase/acylaminoacyl peptidase